MTVSGGRLPALMHCGCDKRKETIQPGTLEVCKEVIILTLTRLSISGNISLLIAVKPVISEGEQCYSLAGITFSLDLWDVGRRNLSPVKLIPIHLGEPPVCKDVG